MPGCGAHPSRRGVVAWLGLLALGANAAEPPSAGASAGPQESSIGPSVPVYAFRLPAPRVLRYDLTRGPFSGTGELEWRPEADRYRARLEGRIAGFSILQWTSEGRIDEAGLAPDRYTDRRRGGGEQAARFDRDEGVVRYSGAAAVQALPRGGQDRLSWMVQMAAIAEARPRPLATGERIALWVTGARSDADLWQFRCTGVDPLPLAAETVRAVHLIREPRERGDTRVDVWLDPQRDHLPVRAWLASGRDGDRLELALRA